MSGGGGITIGSLFSGIGGLELGLEWAGLGPVRWQVEQGEFCRSVLARHWPGVERFEDVREVGARNLERVDLICGGFPCQDVSSAGKGAGLSGSRSGLWFEFARIIGELRPRWVVIENVASGANRWVDAIMAGLEELDYEALPIPLSAADVGAPHKRARIFVVAYTDRPGLEKWEKQKVPPANGAPFRRVGGSGDATDPDPDRQPALAEYEQVGWLCAPTEDGRWEWRPPVSPVCGVDDRVTDRVDRLKALGNSVVPQCAEVIGHVVRSLDG